MVPQREISVNEVYSWGLKLLVLFSKRWFRRFFLMFLISFFTVGYGYSIYGKSNRQLYSSATTILVDQVAYFLLTLSNLSNVLVIINFKKHRQLINKLIGHIVSKSRTRTIFGIITYIFNGLGILCLALNVYFFISFFGWNYYQYYFFKDFQFFFLNLSIYSVSELYYSLRGMFFDLNQELLLLYHKEDNHQATTKIDGIDISAATLAADLNINKIKVIYLHKPPKCLAILEKLTKKHNELCHLADHLNDYMGIIIFLQLVSIIANIVWSLTVLFEYDIREVALNKINPPLIALICHIVYNLVWILSMMGAKATSQIQEAKNFDENDDEVLRSFAPGPRSFSTSRLVGRGRGRSNSNQNNGFANENGNDKGGWKREEGRWEQHTGEVLESNGYEGRGRGRGRGSGRGRGGGRSYSDNEDNDFDGRENRSRDRGRGRGRGGSRGGREGSTMRHNDDDKKVGEDGQPEKPREIYVPVERVADDELFTTTITSGVNFMKLDDIKVNVSGDDVPKPVNSFAASGLRPHLLENIKKSKYMKPTPIQKYAIPIILAGRDLMGCAQTGSGKTAAFLLPMIHKILEKQDPPAREGNTAMPNVVIVSPTRELTIQIYEQAKKFSFNSVVKTVVVYGGTAIHHQRNQVNAGCHILVGTPGRLIDFLQRGHISFSAIDFFVLDEADRMLDMGFLPAIEQMLSHQTMRATGERQTLMFSATFPEEIQHLAGKFLHNYAFISVGIVGSASSDVEQNFFQVTKFDKRKKLLEMLKDCKELTMVFVETKRNADFLATLLSENEISSTSIHGDRLQSQREEALWEFKKGIRKILVATGVASRGLDIEGIQHVINYDLPKSVDEYVHRIGRTGRVGNRGKATSFYDASQDRPLAGELANILKQAGQNVPNFLSGSGGGYADDGDDGNFGGRDIRGEDYGRGQNFNKQPAEAGDEEW